MKKILIPIFMTITLSAICLAGGVEKANKPAYLDENLPIEQRVKDLISKMTLEEKISQMRNDAPAIPRLGIPAYNWWNECLHGVGRAGKATVFPQAIGLSSTWDTNLMHQVANTISDEARAKHNKFLALGKRQIYYGLTFWSPNINIFRDPRWGRGQETYGEDPFLTSRMAVNFIEGLQGNDPKYLKLVATAKHFGVHSGPESTRHQFNAQVSDRDLYDTYLPAFEATVKEANVHSVMCAYNRFRGDACCGSNVLLQHILRDDWKFNGYVVSDCGAIADFYEPGRHGITNSGSEAAAIAVKAGTDVNCGSTFQYLREAVEKGEISVDDIDRSVYRLFEARFKLGMFDSPRDVKYDQIPYDVVACDSNRDLSLKASRESIVLLKNENHLLPLSKNLKSVAVIGPNADSRSVLLGNYHGTALKLTTALDGIVQKLGPEKTVYYAPGCDIAEGISPIMAIPSGNLYPVDRNGTQHGLTGEYFNNRDLEGKPAFIRVDPTIDFIWKDNTPLTGQPADEFSVRWTGNLLPDVDGEYKIGFNGCNGVRFYVNDSLLFKFNNTHEPSERTVSLDLKAGEFYHIKIEYINFAADPQAHLIWSPPVTKDLTAEAINIAKKADAVILVMGLSPKLEGEEMPVMVDGFDRGDRTDIDLPDTQKALLQKIHDLGKPTVLVLMGGSAIAIPWANEHIDAIVDAWYSGERGGQAIADVLFGDYNPAGRLPVTFYKSVKDLPAFDDYDMSNRTYRYFKGAPLYPFGYGLSYTTFKYDKLKLSSKTIKSDGTLEAKVNVTNTGKVAGDEVVELYISDKKASVPVPIRSLRAFKRITLAPGEMQTVTFELSAKEFSIVNDEGRKIVEPGEFELSVGGGQPGLMEESITSGPVTKTTVRFSGKETLVLE